MTSVDNDIIIQVKNDIRIQKQDFDMLMSNIMSGITSQIQKLKAIQEQKCQKLIKFVDKLLDGNVLQNLNLVNKYCNSWYFRDQWTINKDISSNDTHSHMKVTVLPSLGIFYDHVLYDKYNDIYEYKFFECQQRLEPGIYVYNASNMDENNNLYIKIGSENVNVKMFTIYYIKGQWIDDGQNKTQKQKCAVLMSCQDEQKNNHIYLQRFTHDINEKYRQTNEDYQVYSNIGRTDINTYKPQYNPTTKQESTDQLTNYWTINITDSYTDKYPPDNIISNSPAYKLKKLIMDSEAGDIIQWIHNTDDGYYQNQNIKYIFKLSDQQCLLYDYYEETKITTLQLIDIPEQKVYNVNDIQLDIKDNNITTN